MDYRNWVKTLTPPKQTRRVIPNPYGRGTNGTTDKPGRAVLVSRVRPKDRIGTRMWHHVGPKEL